MNQPLRTPGRRSSKRVFILLFVIVVAVLVVALCPFIRSYIHHGSTLSTDGVVPSVIGSVNGVPVTYQSLDTRSKQALYQAQNNVYDEAENILAQRYIKNKVDEYAKANHITSPEQAQSEFFSTQAKVPADKIDRLLAENKSNPALSGKDPTTQRKMVSDYLQQQANQEFARDLVETAVDKGEITIAFIAKPSPINVAVNVGTSPRLGSASAPITIVEFGDYQCPFCKGAFDTVNDVMKEFPGKISLVYKEFPLVRIHPNALPAAMAAQCAGEQNAYWPMHDALFMNQKDLGDALYTKLATQLHLNVATFNTCLKSDAARQRILADMTYGSELGVEGTPGFFINGQVLSGAQTKGAFEKIIREQLKK